MLTTRELKDLFSRYGFRPLKRLGENYLIDRNIKDKIITEIGAVCGETVLEIGPGFGALTVDLAETGEAIYAVEKDKKAFGILSDMAGDLFPSLHLINGDILKFDIGAIARSKKIKVAGCLPYYITTPVIEYIIERRGRVSSAIVVVQKEFAERMLAKPGGKDYSSLSLYIQYYTIPKYIYTIKRTSFYPAPDVDSSLVRLDILEEPSIKVEDEDLFFRIIRGAFNQRRKSIVNSLSRKEVLGLPKEKAVSILKEAGISPKARPEDLSLADFASITNQFVVN